MFTIPTVIFKGGDSMLFVVDFDGTLSVRDTVA